MRSLSKSYWGLVLIITCSCSPSKPKNLSTSVQASVTAPTESTQAADNSVASPLENKSKTSSEMDGTPTGAQIDNKTFLALTDEEALHGLKAGEAQIKIVCDRNVGKVNKVVTAFCTNAMRPKNLVELQAALGLAFPANPAPGRNNNGAANNGPAFAIQGHSSSLVGKFVSAINPRVILMDPTNLGANSNSPTAVVLGFVRGEQFSEIATKNADGSFDFYLVGFKQACNAKPEGCLAADLLTAAVESNWTEFSLYQDEDLKNSIVDCRQCHQPDGPQTAKILRMQELRNPWTHWFRDNTDGNGLIADYTAAWGTDGVGGIPGNMINASDPQQLENFLRGNNMLFTENQAVANGARAQSPNEFLTATIRNEVAANAGKSGTWEALKKRFITRKDSSFTLTGTTATESVAGTARNYIPIPFRELRVTDPALLLKFTQQIKDFKAGTLTPAQFLDTREIFPADQQTVADIGFAVGPTETPQDTLALACSQCHHSGLDPALSRAKFNAVDFSKMPNLNIELDLAISRLKLGYSPERLQAEGIKILDPKGSNLVMHKAEHLLTMPPRRFKQLTDLQIDSLVKLLESQKKP